MRRRIYPFGCTLCSKKFETLEAAQSHVRNGHRPPVACLVCGELFGAAHIDSHLKNEHNVYPQSQCQLCNDQLGQQKEEVGAKRPGKQFQSVPRVCTRCFEALPKCRQRIYFPRRKRGGRRAFVLPASGGTRGPDSRNSGHR